MSQPTVTVVERWCPGRQCLVTTLWRVSDVTTNSYSGGEMVSRSVVFSV